MNSNKILNNQWYSNYNQRVLQFYQYNEQSIIPIRYALYSLSLDRFILIDGLDLWCVEHAAKLLSSKLATIVCIFAVKPPPFGLKDCINWSIANKIKTLPAIQTPETYIIYDSKEFINEGLPYDFFDKIENLQKDQDFVYFVLKVVYAAKLTDLVMGSESGINNVNQNFYMDLFSDKNEKQVISAAFDKVGWKNNFLSDISEIIYRSQSIDEILIDFKKIESDTHLNQPQFNYKKLYLDYFFSLFYEDPSA